MLGPRDGRDWCTEDVCTIVVCDHHLWEGGKGLQNVAVVQVVAPGPCGWSGGKHEG